MAEGHGVSSFVPPVLDKGKGPFVQAAEALPQVVRNSGAPPPTLNPSRVISMAAQPSTATGGRPPTQKTLTSQNRSMKAMWQQSGRGSQ